MCPAGDPKIHDLDRVVLSKTDVALFDVPVHDSLLVCCTQSSTDLQNDIHLLFEAEGRLLLHEGCQIPANNVLHYDVGHALVVPEVIDGDDVRVLETSCQTGLLLQSANELGLFQIHRGKKLDGYVPFDHRIVGVVNGTHSALAQKRKDLILIDSLRRLPHGHNSQDNEGE